MTALAPLLLCEVSELNVSVKRSARLSRPPWFVAKLEAARLDDFIPFPTLRNDAGSPDREVTAVAILQVSAGAVCSFRKAIPEHIPQEFELQWLAYHQPDDVFSVLVDQCFPVDILVAPYRTM